MAEGNDQLWNHIAELHKGHSDLKMQIHDLKGSKGDKPGGDKAGEKGEDPMHGTLKELLQAIRDLTAVMKQDVSADTKVASSMSGKPPKEPKEPKGG